ncbi:MULTISPECIES: hypothetical protein [unclassified Microcoleus]|uniref:hypothetical protein n=1 Tax=unclassified Microcoleus TaxID=2642155 RepID=UPI002FD20279
MTQPRGEWRDCQGVLGNRCDPSIIHARSIIRATFAHKWVQIDCEQLMWNLKGSLCTPTAAKWVKFWQISAMNAKPVLGLATGC